MHSVIPALKFYACRPLTIHDYGRFTAEEDRHSNNIERQALVTVHGYHCVKIQLLEFIPYFTRHLQLTVYILLSWSAFQSYPVVYPFICQFHRTLILDLVIGPNIVYVLGVPSPIVDFPFNGKAGTPTNGHSTSRDPPVRPE
jgi:hypothetical protein